MGVLFFLHGQNIMIQELRSRLQDTAAMAAVQFNPDRIEAVRTREDMQKSDYGTLVTRLRNTRDTLPTIRFVYILRKTEDPNMLTFVADADGLSTDAELDRNKNGVVDEDEKPSYPGDAYDITNVPALHNLTQPTVDESYTVDQWGALISGYAPIRNASGSEIAILGVDMDAADFEQLSQKVFSPVASLLIAIAGVIMAAYVLIVQRQRRLESIQQLNRERTALMDLATHQLGAPIATFKWWIEILKEHHKIQNPTPEATAEDEDAFVQLDEGISRMDDIISSLRTALHVQNSQVEFKAIPTKVAIFFITLPQTTLTRMRRHNQTLSLQIPPELEINVDPKLFAGVLQELVENASWYSPDNTVITVRAEEKRQRVIISVEDQGMGIDSDDLKHLFEQFKRGKNATQKKPVGNGLGLFIAKGIVEGARGTIAAESAPDKGTTFTITLPSV